MTMQNFPYTGHHGPPDLSGPPEPPPGPRRPTRAERRLAAEAARAQREAIRDQARRDHERRREQLRAERAARRAAAAQAWRVRLAAWWHRLVLVAAIVGVNAVAVLGQVEAFKGFDWPLIQAIAVAAVVESIAIYVGWHAHVALVEGDSVMRLRLTSYAIAAGVGALNYHHYAPDWVPSEKAIMFGFASLLSPWLWAMHSRHQHRAQLRAAGLIDPRAPKFSALRWLLWRRETWAALRWAVRHGEQSPSAAILGVQLEQATAEATALAAGARADVVRAQAALIAAQSAALEVAGKVKLPVSSADRGGDSSGDRDRPDEQDNRDCERWIRASMRRGRLPKLSEVRERYPYSHGWAQARVRAVRDEMTAKGWRVLPGNKVLPPADTTGGRGGDQDATAGGAS